MPPCASGLLMPSRPRSPSFLNRAWAGKGGLVSHSSTKGLISLSTKLRTVRRISSCSWVNFMGDSSVIFVFASERGKAKGSFQKSFVKRSGSKPCHTEGVALQRAPFRLAADIQHIGQNLAGITRINQAVVPQMRGAIQRGGLLFQIDRRALFQQVK